MTIKTRPHLHYAPISGGVYFSSARRQFVVRGPEVLFHAVDTCLPLLSDGADENTLVTALGSERARPLVRHLTAMLREHDMLLEQQNFTVSEPAQQVRERYPEVLARLESVSPDPYAAFARLQATTVALIGPPETTTPASRGLTRAGVGHLIVIDSLDPVDPATYRGADAVIQCFVATGSGGAASDPGAPNLAAPALAEKAVGAGGPVPVQLLVPVLLHDEVLIAGPVIIDDRTRAAWSAFCDRALEWTRGSRNGPAARPLADALAGALAGHLLVDVLTGIAVPGAAHVVDGAHLRADQVLVNAVTSDGGTTSEVALTADTPGGSVHRPRISDRAARARSAEASKGRRALEDGGRADDTAGMSLTLAQRWTGLMEPSASEPRLPQMPLALRAVEPRSHPATAPDTVLEWGTDQESVTRGIVLEVLRRECTGPGTPAAGPTRRHWLLDGVLRSLAGEARPLENVTREEVSTETSRIWGSLARLQPDVSSVRLLHVPGIDWRLAQLVRANTGAVRAQAWAPDGDQAARAALSTALASAQTRQHGLQDAVGTLSTHALVEADEAALDALHEQALAEATAARRGYRGLGRNTDAVLGAIPYWFGPVLTHPLPEGPPT